jgi:hypothetical protein
MGGTTNAVMTCPARTKPDDTVHPCVRFDRQASRRRPPVVRRCPRGVIPWCECSTRCNDTCGMGRCLTRGTSAASRVGFGGCRGSSRGWPRTPTSGRGGGVPHVYRARLPEGTDQHRRCRIDRAPGGAPADGEAVAAGRASTGRALTAANPDPGVQRGVGSGVASVGARGSNTSRLAGGVTYGTVTVSP